METFTASAELDMKARTKLHPPTTIFPFLPKSRLSLAAAFLDDAEGTGLETLAWAVMELEGASGSLPQNLSNGTALSPNAKKKRYKLKFR